LSEQQKKKKKQKQNGSFRIFFNFIFNCIKVITSAIYIFNAKRVCLCVATLHTFLTDIFHAIITFALAASFGSNFTSKAMHKFSLLPKIKKKRRKFCSVEKFPNDV
jgi:hypothetical protein